MIPFEAYEDTFGKGSCYESYEGVVIICFKSLKEIMMHHCLHFMYNLVNDVLRYPCLSGKRNDMIQSSLTKTLSPEI